ncbi:RAMP superfamily CRISPR-associated protein [uncultured Chloroflexus sp.]|uniref:RAMP superfamily CRISPR-associated protein n=1 Tax=uncultured Chloroflexus sp. TaxID=214040 RepID=UPI0026241FDA|nr:RAMP superfamily CRISPR-associated protein [uncultured Chloroflexus sp.]
MTTYMLRFTLQSGATFGRGDGVAGLLDEEVDRDADGMPFLRGRTLKGLLAEECANLLYALTLQEKAEQWRDRAYRVFGYPGSTSKDTGMLRVGDARLPKPLRDAIRVMIDTADLSADEVFESLTAIRRQTSINEHGAPEKGSLRSMRIILPGTIFESRLEFAETPDDQTLALVAACVLAWRRAGTGRNRGRGRLQAHLLDSDGTDITERFFRVFAGKVAQ